MSTNIAEIAAFKPEPMPLEECLAELEKYGRPKIGKYDRGWHSSIKVFVTGTGVDFEVCSEFGILSPKDAANQCYQRLAKALKQIKNGET